MTPSPRSSFGFSYLSKGEPLYSFSHLLQKYFENLSSGNLPIPAKNSSGPPRFPFFCSSSVTFANTYPPEPRSFFSRRLRSSLIISTTLNLIRSYLKYSAVIVFTPLLISALCHLNCVIIIGRYNYIRVIHTVNCSKDCGRLIK